MASEHRPSLRPALHFSPWQAEYQAALQERDRRVLFKRVEIAESALLNRREALRHETDGRVERQEIEKALAKLRTVKREILNFPL